MSRLRRIASRGLTGRAIAKVLAVVVLLAVLGGVAWAVDITRSKRVDVSATYTIRVASGESAEQHLFTVGQVDVGTGCFADPGSEADGFSVGSFAGTVTNNGPDPVILVVGEGRSLTTDEEPNAMKIGPGESEAFGNVGVLAAENLGKDGGGLVPFAILHPGGQSASGVLSFSAHVPDPVPETNPTGTCVVSAHMRG